MRLQKFDPSVRAAREIHRGAMVMYAALKDEDQLDPDGQLLSAAVISEEFLRSLRKAPTLESHQ